MGIFAKGLMVAAPLALAARAADGITVTYSTIYDYRYDPQQVSATGAPLPLEVRGAPPGVTAADVAAVTLVPAHVRRRLVAAEPGEDGPRLVIGFAPASGEALCAPGGGPASPHDPLTLSGAYCVGVQAYTSGITKSRSGGLPGAASNLVRNLLPTFNPERTRRRRQD